MNVSNVLLQFIPLGLLSICTTVLAYLLARDKGRNVKLWTVVGLIPGVNFFALSYFIGASNLRMERKLDQLLQDRRNE